MLELTDSSKFSDLDMEFMAHLALEQYGNGQFEQKTMRNRASDCSESVLRKVEICRCPLFDSY